MTDSPAATSILTAQHDDTPGYTDVLGAPQGSIVRVRLRTTLPVTSVTLRCVRIGEVEGCLLYTSPSPRD